jgi:ribosomal RNA-processing protein 9
LTSGSRDRTCRLWKIPEESQLVFRGGGGGLTVSEDTEVLETLGAVQRKREKDNGASGGSIEQVSMLDEEYFVSGSDSGAISLWINSKKKPLYTRLKCHGAGSPILMNGAETVLGQDFGDGCCWITSLTTIRYSDLFASGSADGYIRFWKLSATKKSFSLVNCIPVAGFVNSLAFFNAPPLNNHDKERAEEKADAVQEFGTSEAGKRILKDAENSKERHQIGNNELYIAAAIGPEHRLGRWWKMKGIKNSILVSSLGAAFI